MKIYVQASLRKTEITEAVYYFLRQSVKKAFYVHNGIMYICFCLSLGFLAIVYIIDQWQ